MVGNRLSHAKALRHLILGGVMNLDEPIHYAIHVECDNCGNTFKMTIKRGTTFQTARTGVEGECPICLCNCAIKEREEE